MKEVIHFELAFISMIKKHIEIVNYIKARLLFDQYVENVLKVKTRAKRMKGRNATAEYELHDRV